MKNEFFKLKKNNEGIWLVETTDKISSLVIRELNSPIEKRRVWVNWKVFYEELFLDGEGEFLMGHSHYREEKEVNNADWQKEVFKDVHREIFITPEGLCLVFNNIVEKIERGNKIRYSTIRVLSERQSLSEIEKQEILQSLYWSYEWLCEKMIEIKRETEECVG